MTKTREPYETILDFVTGKCIPNIGSEENRQSVERFLVTEKGYDKKDIEVDADIEVVVDGRPYRSQVDLVVSLEGKRVTTIKCVAGSLGSWEREILSVSRLLDRYQIPISVVSDGKTACVFDTVSGNKIGEGLQAIPSKKAARKILCPSRLHPFPEKRLKREMRIFRSYDMMNVNVNRNL